MIVPPESCRVNGIGCNITRPRTITSLHQAANGAKSQLEIVSVVATANVGSKNTTSTNTLGTSGSDISSGDSDSSYTETESGTVLVHLQQAGPQLTHLQPNRELSSGICTCT